jgi:hypothetical protein
LRDGLIQATIHGDGKHRIAYLISSQEAATQVEITGIGAIEARVLDGDTLTVCGGRVKISVPGWETVLVSWDEP